MVKLILLSDTHGRHRDFTIPPGDILIFAGDLMTCGYRMKEVESFGKWFSDQPHPHKIFCAGNHDRLFESNPEACLSHFSKDVVYLNNTSTTAFGFKIHGSPAQPEFCNWAFNYRRGAHINRIWQQIPDDTDVLITHGPPAGIQDWAKPKTASLGCRDLLHAVIRVKPKLHVFGHIHGGYGEWQGTTTHFVNASLLDERYQPVNQPIAVDLSI
jgi:predicted phosphohydrolase